MVAPTMTAHDILARDFWTDVYRNGVRNAPTGAPRSADEYARTLADTLTIRHYRYTRPQLDELHRSETEHEGAS